MEILKTGCILFVVAVAGFFIGINAHPVKIYNIPLNAPYLSMCSGVQINSPDSWLIAKTNCLGRIAGYSAGHEMSIELNNLFISRSQPANKNERLAPLWCIPIGTSDGAILDRVENWVINHPADWQLVSKNLNSLNGSLVLASRALVLSYPCK